MQSGDGELSKHRLTLRFFLKRMFDTATENRSNLNGKNYLRFSKFATLESGDL